MKGYQAIIIQGALWPSLGLPAGRAMRLWPALSPLMGCRLFPPLMGWPALPSVDGMAGFPQWPGPAGLPCVAWTGGRAGRQARLLLPTFLPNSSPAAAATTTRVALSCFARRRHPHRRHLRSRPPPTHGRPAPPSAMCHMEVYDEDGTPALPFAVPPPVPVQYDIPPGMVSHDNLVLSRTYDKLGSAVNGIFTRIHDEPKIDVVPHYEVATTKALVDEVLWVVLRVSNLIQQIEGNGGVAFAMPQVLKEGIDFIRPFGTD